MTGVVLIKSAVAIGVVESFMVGMAVIDPSVTNLIGAVIGGVVAITLGWFGFRTTMATLNKKVDMQAEKLDQTLKKTEVIEGHVNSEKTEAQGKITSLQKENALLREIMADKKETAALLAQAAATASVPATTALATLKNIAKHTSDTADNTARTEEKLAATQELKDKP